MILGRQRMRKEKGREEKTTSKKSSEEHGPARAKRRAEKAANSKEGQRREENPDPKPRGIGAFFGSVSTSVRFGSTVPVSLLGSQVPVLTVPVPRFAVRFLPFLSDRTCLPVFQSFRTKAKQPQITCTPSWLYQQLAGQFNS